MKNRRELIKQISALGLLPTLGLSTFNFLNCAQAASKKKTLIVIFQRGAVDALSMVQPTGDQYFNKELRPSLFIPKDKLISLDSFFSLNPNLKSFQGLWDKGQLSVIHQVGSPSSSRSHFDSQDYFEMGTPDNKKTENGFLARASSGLPINVNQKLNSLAVQPNLPKIFSGDSKTLSFDDLNSFSVKGFSDQSKSNSFENFFEGALDEVLKGHDNQSAGLLNEFVRVKKIKTNEEFPKGQLSNRLKDIAKIIKSDIYIPFITTEVGGWDTHVNQGAETGNLANRLKDFSDTIAAFVKEIGSKIEDVTIITVSEFGRTVRENGNKGTDHGHGSSYFVIGGGLKNKNIIADWKDLKKENLYEERDLPVTTDFRDVFSEILSHQFGLSKMDVIFPNYKRKSKKLGIFKS